jgi:hypothetical protein
MTTSPRLHGIRFITRGMVAVTLAAAGAAIPLSGQTAAAQVRYTASAVSNPNPAGLATPRSVGTGWNMFSGVYGAGNMNAGDMNGDGHPDILGVTPGGDLYLYTGTDTTGVNDSAGLNPGVQIGTGWNMFSQLVTGYDFTGDGKPDVLGITPDGDLYRYAGNGNGGVSASGMLVGTGWNMFSQVIGVNKLTGDGSAGLLGITPDGAMWWYPTNGTAVISNGTQIGTGWNMFTQVLAGDFNHDGVTDLLGVTPDGALDFYGGDGTTEFGTGQTVGSGWNMFSQVLSPGDLNGDGTSDILGITPDGVLYFYAGTGTTGE